MWPLTSICKFCNLLLILVGVVSSWSTKTKKNLWNAGVALFWLAVVAGISVLIATNIGGSSLFNPWDCSKGAWARFESSNTWKLSSLLASQLFLQIYSLLILSLSLDFSKNYPHPWQCVRAQCFLVTQRWTTELFSLYCKFVIIAEEIFYWRHFLHFFPEP